jgi:peptidyl-tRNA hydrolase
MKLIVGLGNPGKSYDNTRHNVGFDFVDIFLKKQNVLEYKKKFNGLYAEINYKGEKILILKPQSYMNLSGEVVKSFVSYFKIDLEDILIIHDDLDIKSGNIKIKESGSSGGHNGLKNIELHLGTKDYKRMKIGISKSEIIDTKDYVLGKINGQDKEKIDEIMEMSDIILKDYLEMTFTNLMNKYNKKQDT